MQLTTTDLYESSYLVCCGVPLKQACLDHGRGRKTVVFLFEGDLTLRELQAAYHNGLADVNLAQYRTCLEKLKDLTFQLVRGEAQERNWGSAPYPAGETLSPRTPR